MTSEIVSGPLAQAIGLALLHLLWQGAVVAGLLAAALALLTRSSASVRYVVSCFALALLLGLGVFTAIRSYEPEAPPAARAAEGSVTPSTDLLFYEDPAPAPTWRDDARGMLFAVQRHIPQIVLLWFAGVLLLTIRLTVSWSRAQALVTRRTVEAPLEWQAIITHLSHALRLRRTVRLLQSTGVEVPSVIGWIRPVILIPVSGLTGLTASQIEMILAHELAHIRRHDFLVNALQSVAETLLFYHPAAWWMSSRIRIERENCCDDLAVSVCGNALQYARALTQLEQMRGVNAAAMAATGGSLLGRVRRLAGIADRTRVVNGWTAAAAALSFVALIAITTSPANAARKPAAKKPPAPPAVIAVTPAPTPEAAPMAQAVADGVADAVRVQAPRAHVDVAAALDDEPDIDVEVDDDQESTPTPDGKLSIDDLISLRVSGVTPEYIDSMRKIFGETLSVREASNLRMQGVTSDYVREMRAIFTTPVSAREVMNLKVQGVTPSYVADMRSAGVDIKSAREAVSLKVQGVTPAFVKSLRDAGYEKITARDLARLAAVGVNADFIREMSKYRTDKKTEKKQ